MRNRVSNLLLRAGILPAQPWLSTFIRSGALLRREAAVGLPGISPFTMTYDQLAAVKLAMNNCKSKMIPGAANRLSRISYAKKPRPDRGTT